MHTQNPSFDHSCPDQPVRRQGLCYAPHDANAPMLEGIDIAGLIAAIIITLGPLAAGSGSDRSGRSKWLRSQAKPKRFDPNAAEADSVLLTFTEY